jgi:hypothetical protein
MQISVLARLLYNALPREFPGITTVEVTSSLQTQAERQAPGADFATWPKPEDIAMVSCSCAVIFPTCAIAEVAPCLPRDGCFDTKVSTNTLVSTCGPAGTRVASVPGAPILKHN